MNNNQNFENQILSNDSERNILTLNKIIKWCIYIFVGLMPLWFLPFTTNILELNKQVLMVIVLTIALIAWLGKLLTQEKTKWYKGLIVIFFLAFVLIYGLATIFSMRPYNSLMGLDNHLSRALINTIYFFIFFLMLVNHGAEDKERRNIEILKVLIIFIASSVVAGLISFLQVLGVHIFPWDFAKSASFNTIGSLTSLGVFVAVVIPLSLGLLFSIKQRGEEKKERIITMLLRGLLVVCVCLSLILLLLLNFRNSWIITAVGMLMISGFWLAKRHFLKSQNLAWLAIPTAILALSLIFLVFKPVLFDLNLPLEVGLTQRGGIDIVKKALGYNPILGSGPENFIYNYSLYKPETINQTILWNVRFNSAPSEILSLVSEIGILGVLAFLALIGISLFNITKNLISNNGNSRLTEIKVGLFSSWLALTISWFIYPQNTVLLFVFWLLLALLTVMSSNEKDIKIINLKTSNKIAVVTSFGFIIVIIAMVGLLYLEGSKFIAETKYRAGLDLAINKGELDEGINKVVRATVTNPYEDKFYRTLSQLFINQIEQNLNNQNLDSQDRADRVQTAISNAINSAVRATTLNSEDVSNWIIRGFVYRSLITLINDSADWAIKSYEKAAALEPTNPYIYLEIGRTYVNIADLLREQAEKDPQAKNQMEDYLDKAVETYNKAIELKSNYAPANYEIALVYNRQGKTDEAIAKMESSLQLVPRDTGVAFQLGVLYYRDSQFNKAKLAFARAVSLDPNFSNARYFLGLLLDKEDNKSAAIEQFEKIAELNPDNEMVEKILTNLRAGRPAFDSSELTQPEEIPIKETQPGETETRLPGGD